MADVNATTTAAPEAEKPWYESLLTGIGEVAGEALAIKTAGYLSEEREKAGLSQYPDSADQVQPVVDANGGNLTGTLLTGQGGDKTKNWLMIGGGVVLIAVIIISMSKG